MDDDRWDLLYICQHCNHEYTTYNENNEFQMRPCDRCGVDNSPIDSVKKRISIFPTTKN